MAFGDELRARREAIGLSTTQAARQYGVAQGTWSLWENGKRVPEESRQAAILASLNVPVPAVRGDYRDGALWALAAMHETLARCYRELAAGPMPTLPDPRAAARSARAVRDAARSPAPTPPAGTPRPASS